MVQDAAAYRRLQEAAALAEKAEMKAFLDEAMAEIEAGRTIPALPFLESLRRTL